jgi:hypothetical protein
MIDWGEEYPLSRGHNAAIKLKFDVLKRGIWAPNKNIINEKIDAECLAKRPTIQTWKEKEPNYHTMT